MVSTKFKPGQKVYYISGQNKRFGIVCPASVANTVETNHPSLGPVVWAYWGEWTEPTYCSEEQVFAAEPPKPKRNLPSWF